MARNLSIRRQPRVHYNCETLEPRTLLNAIPAGGVLGPTITINGTAGNDLITISAHTGGRFGQQSEFVDWTVNGGPTQSAQVLPTYRVLVDAGTGTDEVMVQNTPGVPIFIQGESPTDDILKIGGPNGLQGISGSITVLTNQAAFWDITADDSGDTTSRTATLSASSATGPLVGTLTGLAPGVINWDVSRCHGLAIDTSSGGGNTLNVLQTSVSTQIRGHSAGPDDTVTVGNSSDGLRDITAGLSIGNETPAPAGLIHLTLDDQARPVTTPATNYVLDSGSLGVGSLVNPTRLVTWNGSILRSITLKTQAAPLNSAGQAVVESTSVSTMVVGDSAGLAVQVGPSNNTNNILGNLYITNLAGETELGIDDSQGNAAAPTVTLHTISIPGDSAPYGAIDGLTPATIAYRYPDTHSVGVDGAGGASVHIAAAQTAVSVFDVPLVTVGDAGSTQNINGSIGVGNASLTLDDSADPASRQVTVSSLGDAAAIFGMAPALVLFSAPGGPAEALTINGGSGANQYTVDGFFTTSLAASVTLNIGGGNDAVQISGAAFTMPLIVNGQGGNDAFTVNDSDMISGLTMKLNGGSGSDTLTVNGPASDTSLLVGAGIIVSGPSDSNNVTIIYTAFKTLALATGTFDVTGDLGGLHLTAYGTTTVELASTHLGAVSIGAATQVWVVPGPMPLSNTLFCTSLSIDPVGKLDLANNSLQLTYSTVDPVATIRSYLSSGYNNGTWNGNGIVTSAGDATHGLSLSDSADGTVAGLPANTILVRWTLLGAVTLNAKDGFADLIVVARNYGKTGMNWDQGDMDYDGVVGFDDLVLVARNYGATAAFQSVSAMVAAAPLEMPIKTRRRR